MRTVAVRLLGAALIGWLLALAGCGRMPTAPEPGAGPAISPGGSGSAGVTLPEATPDSRAPRGSSPGGAKLPKIAPAPIVDPLVSEVELVVDGAVGCDLQAGNVTLRVPPHAFDGVAQIKVTPDAGQLACHLEIFPPDKNNFQVPVTLVFNTGSVPDPRLMTIFWFDDSARQWVAIPSSVDPGRRTISAELPHFSYYRVDTELRGRAGW